MAFLMKKKKNLKPGGAAQYSHLITSLGLQLQIHDVLTSINNCKEENISPSFPYHPFSSIFTGWWCVEREQLPIR